MTKLSEHVSKIRVGCAGWAIPREHAALFPGSGTHLERYSANLPAVEINSSFYKPHRPTTYRKWAEAVPDDFRFAVKVPKAVTHEERLGSGTAALDGFLSEVSELGKKLGPLLVQLPPSLPFVSGVAENFFGSLRDSFAGQVALEPRHPSWFDALAERVLATHKVARVAADPAVVPEAAHPGGWRGLVYYRLHGSPKMYYSEYTAQELDALTLKLRAAPSRADVWCIFDNTAAGAASQNACAVLKRLAA